ncbi:hypothetical protein BKP37_18560 [Anaerobacillus alkalilacustris]|uniref:PD-(D/E)XK endonuclease-like domain-containing protein n=1 Tax=Anaerobacillus alkalilacustris TaxID=393763 RepID=A0A1S2LFQ9_9BACI|nr:PD-(D/E)XK nuclease family protein [Anaerobacillus alkalilacustris]OIJ10537.1 hypothetical protein BKP37_18560 [Anaerobacillus alkalilacustris]
MLVVKYSDLKDVAKTDRLTKSFQRQKEVGKPIYYILPSNKWLQAARKRKAGMAFKTFDDLADLLLKKANINYFPVSESERTIFFQELMSNDKNRFLNNPQELRHKAKAIAETYGQLKRIGLTLENLPTQFRQMEPIFREYETEWVKKKRLLDPENRIHEAVSLQMNQELNLGGIVIDGYLDFSTLQYMVIAYFVSLGIDITVYLPRLQGAEIVEGTEKQLEKLGFTVDKEEIRQIMITKSNVEVKSATTMEEEIYGVLQEISEKSQVTPLTNIGILLTDESVYQEKLIKAAEKKQLPLKVPVKKTVKDTQFIQFIYKSLLKHNGRFVNRWDTLDLVDTMLRLYFFKSINYMNKKKNYIETGFLPEDEKKQVEAFIDFRKTIPKKTSVITYLSLLKELLVNSDFPSSWKKQILEEKNTEKLQQIRLEWKAYDFLVTLVSRKIEMLEKQGLQDLQVHYHIFVDWLYEGIQGGSIFVERTPVTGIQLYSFRDVGLFEGKILYVLGMNEGTFPKGHKLSGYFQESDLKNLPVPYASPTKKLFRQKDDTFFQQLFELADEVSFSYVVGVDPHNPLLPSGYLEAWKDQIQDRKYSAANRYTEKVSDSQNDYEEKMAYHVGVGKLVHQLPESLERMVVKLSELEGGIEKVSPYWEERLKRDKLSVTMLESYAMCPFKYALERILKIKEPVEKQTILDFRDVGSMLHDIIEKFYKQLNLIGKPFSALTEEMKETAETFLLDIFEEEWSIVEANHLDFSKLQLSIEKEEWLKKLKKWWHAERHHFWENKQLQSMHLFRLEEAVELDIKLDDDITITMSGKIDRVDIDDHGFVIYDYKSGFASLNFKKEVRPGLKLQLPLYLVAMEKRLANGHYQIDLTECFESLPENLTAHGASYISLREPLKRAGNSVWREEHFRKNSPFSVNSYATKEETLEAEALLAKYELKQRIKELWQGSSHDFSVRPLKCISSCAYRPVCRVTQDQIEEGEGEFK